MKIKSVITLASVFLLPACVNTHTSVLPKEKFTTSDIIKGQNKEHKQYVYFSTHKLLNLDTNQASSTTRAQIEDLNRDFQRVPNPEIVGFVYAHMSGDVPIPGYATVFKLYDKEHYAVHQDGFIKERNPNRGSR